MVNTVQCCRGDRLDNTINFKTRGNFFNLIKNNYKKPTVEVHFRNGILRKYVNQFSNRMRINGENYVLKTPFKKSL